GRTAKSVCDHLPRGRQLQRRQEEIMIALVIAFNNSEEQRLLVPKRRVERGAFDTRGLRQVSVRRALVAFAPKHAKCCVQCLIHIEFAITSHQSDHLNFFITVDIKKASYPIFISYFTLS